MGGLASAAPNLTQADFVIMFLELLITDPVH
jgi:hypothetical protein